MQPDASEQKCIDVSVICVYSADVLIFDLVVEKANAVKKKKKKNVRLFRLPVRMKLQGHLTGGGRSEFIMVHFTILCRAEITVYRNSSVVHRLFCSFQHAD